MKPKARAKFDHVTFGKWHDWFIEKYLITVVVSDESVIPEPTLSREQPDYIRRFSWIGNLTQSRVAFRISNVTLADAGKYGCRLDFDRIDEEVSKAVTLNAEVGIDWQTNKKSCSLILYGLIITSPYCGTPSQRKQNRQAIWLVTIGRWAPQSSTIAPS